MVSVPRYQTLQLERSSVDELDTTEPLGHLDGVIRQLVFGVKPNAGTVAGITSAIDGEGKTTICRELALALSRFAPTDRPVLVVDCQQPFVSHASSNERALHAVRPQAMVLRESTVTGALELLRSRHAFILLDMPSLLNDPVAAALAKQVDHLYMVVRAGTTKADLLRRAVASVREANFEGLILNDVESRVPDWLARVIG